MDESRSDGKTCYFHPNEVVIGVCAFCLNERLLILASKQEQKLQYQSNGMSFYGNRSFSNERKTQIHLPKIFTLSSLLNRLDIKHRKTEENDQSFSCGSSTPEEDSFISIKFEDNGSASWEKGTTLMPKVSMDQCDMSWNQTLEKKEEGGEGVRVIVEHVEPRASSLRWRKRIGHLFQLMRWKRSSKGNVGTKLEGVKVRNGWIRTLTKRRTKE